MTRLVVTSTAGGAVGYAARCVLSVSNQITGYDAHGEGYQVAHWFSSSDAATHLDVVHTARESKADVTAELAKGSDSPLSRLVPMWDLLAPDDVVIWLDGDDELTPGAIERVARFHELDGVWLTYGSFERDDGWPDYHVSPVFGRRYREPPRSSAFRATHLRTFRAGLVQALLGSASEYLLDERGDFFKASPDVAVMVSLLELAGERYFVSTDVLCRYNYAHAAKSALAIGAQRRDVFEIGQRKPLPRLPERPW